MKQLFFDWLTLANTMASVWPITMPGLKDQIKRASISAVLNLAEGCGKITPKDKRKFYAIARGSVLEISAGLDVAHVLGHLNAANHQQLQRELLAISKMISKLIKTTS